MDDKPFDEFLIDWSAFLGGEDEQVDEEAKRKALRDKILGQMVKPKDPIQTGSQLRRREG